MAEEVEMEPMEIALKDLFSGVYEIPAISSLTPLKIQILRATLAGMSSPLPPLYSFSPRPYNRQGVHRCCKEGYTQEMPGPESG